MKIVQCWLEHPVRRLDQTFTYLYNDEDIEVGSRVTIPLLNRSVVGFVESIQDTDETREEIETRLGFKLRYIQDVKDQESLISDVVKGNNVIDNDILFSDDVTIEVKTFNK